MTIYVVIGVYCGDVCGGLRRIDMENVDDKELYWLWYVLELLESCETQIDHDSYEELIDDELNMFESCDIVRY